MDQLRLAGFGLALVAGSVMAGPTAERYAEGQVWEYQTRPQNKGSLLKFRRSKCFQV